jgi:hypothetical protein
VIRQRVALFAAGCSPSGRSIGAFSRPVVAETPDCCDLDRAKSEEIPEDLIGARPTHDYERRTSML